MLLKLIILSLVVIAIPSWVGGETKTYLLEGLEPVFVEVNVGNEVRRYLTEDRAKTIIELELRKSSVPVTKEMEKAAGVLFFSVIALERKDYSSKEVIGFSMTIRGGLDQWVVPTRNKDLLGIGTTWENVSVAYYGTKIIREALEKDALRIVQAFANEYLNANPDIVKD